MQVHIFRGAGRVFGFTEDATGANLPPQYGPWNTFKAVILSRNGEPTPGVNIRECLDDIQKHGFHITDAHVRITESQSDAERASPQQCLRASLLDEMQIDLVSVLLGAGVRLFGHLSAENIDLEVIKLVPSPGVTHLRFRVVYSETSVCCVPFREIAECRFS